MLFQLATLTTAMEQKRFHSNKRFGFSPQFFILLLCHFLQYNLPIFCLLAYFVPISCAVLSHHFLVVLSKVFSATLKLISKRRLFLDCRVRFQKDSSSIPLHSSTNQKGAVVNAIRGWYHMDTRHRFDTIFLIVRNVVLLFFYLFFQVPIPSYLIAIVAGALVSRFVRFICILFNWTDA